MEYTQEVVSDGTLVELALSIDYFSRAEITVYFNDVEVPEVDSRWNWLGTSSTLQFTPAVPNGTHVKVQRRTSIDAMRHAFGAGAQFIASVLDENFEQLRRRFIEGSPGLDVDASVIPAEPPAGLTGAYVQYVLNSIGVKLADLASSISMTASAIYTAIAAQAVTTTAEIATSAATTLAAAAASLSSQVAVYATGAGASLIGFIQAGTDTVLRTVQSKLRDRTSVFDFLTEAQIADIRAGTQTPALDPTAAIQAGINANTVYAKEFFFPAGVYRLTAPLTTALAGQKFTGESQYGAYLLAPAASTFDLIRVANQRCEVSGFIFRPVTAAQTCLVIYAGRAHVHGNYFLAAVNNSGTAIQQLDVNPVTLAVVSGAYTHTIENNTIGDSGFAFQYGILDSTTLGVQACEYRENRILSDRPMVTNIGGGNVYGPGNLMQSSTGTAGTKAGVGISLGATVSGEKIFGNYFELFLAMVSTLNTSTTYQIFNQYANHNDNNTSTVSDAGSKNYINEDAAANVQTRNGWVESYASASLWARLTPGGVTAFAVDASGHCFMGATTGANHIINAVGAAQGGLIVAINGSGSNSAYFKLASGTGGNGANAALNLNANSVTSRSLNAGGTLNASGADYAEYMVRSILCGLLGKGQVVGITAAGELTDKWLDAVAFMVKSTNPSIVGGDTWAAHLGQQPEIPVRVERVTEQALITDTVKATSDTDGEKAVYETRVIVEGDGDDEWAAKIDAYAVKLATWEVAHESARARVDRIAFAGQVPVNVLGATPGDYIVPVQDGDGIKGIAVSEDDLTFGQYRRCIGKVIAIEADGRARIIVKVS